MNGRSSTRKARPWRSPTWFPGPPPRRRWRCTSDKASSRCLTPPYDGSREALVRELNQSHPVIARELEERSLISWHDPRDQVSKDVLASVLPVSPIVGDRLPGVLDEAPEGVPGVLDELAREGNELLDRGLSLFAEAREPVISFGKDVAKDVAKDVVTHVVKDVGKDVFGVAWDLVSGVFG